MAFTLSGDAATTRANLGLGDAATKTTGTAAGNIPVLDGSGNMPAVDGSALTGIEALPAGGTVGQLLTNTASGTGTWQDSPVGGKVLQVVQSVTSATTQFAINSTFVDMGLSVSITPSSATSKILVTASVATGGNQGHAAIKLLRGTTELNQGGECWMTSGYTNAEAVSTTSGTYLDSPAATTAQTYKLTLNNQIGNWCFINRSESSGVPDCVSSITVMEIGA